MKPIQNFPKIDEELILLKKNTGKVTISTFTPKVDLYQ